jgi:hypothetical protein
MSGEKPSVLEPYRDLERLPPEQRDPERYKAAEALSDAIIARIEAEVNETGIVRAKFKHSQMNRLIDALKWHLPQKVLNLLKLDEKIAVLNERKRLLLKERRLDHGINEALRAKGRDVLGNRRDRNWFVGELEAETEMMETMRTYLMGAISITIRGWEMGQDDQRMLDSITTMMLVMSQISAGAAAFLELRVYRVERFEGVDGTPQEREVPFEHPLFGSTE